MRTRIRSLLWSSLGVLVTLSAFVATPLGQDYYRGIGGPAAGPLGIVDGDATKAGLYFNNEPSTGLVRLGAGSMAIEVLGVNRFTADATSTSVRSPNGGAYLIVNDGLVNVNSAVLVMGSGGTGYTRWVLPGTTAGQLNLATNSGTFGVGFDVGASIFKIRNMAQTGDAPLTALNASVSGGTTIATTSTDGVTLINPTAATLGIPLQYSPRIRLRSNGWDTDNTVSRTQDFWAEVIPQSDTNAFASYAISYSLDGAAAVPVLTLDMNANVGFKLYSGAYTLNSGSFSTPSTTLWFWNGRSVLASTADGMMNLSNNAQTIGSRFKADALPTVSSGFGTSPAVVAGSTPFAGGVNVGTGGVATTGIVAFNGTAFPTAPYCVVANTSSTGTVQSSASTTQLTIANSGAWTAGNQVNWVCISAK